MSNIFNYRNNVLYFTPEVPRELYPNGVEQRTILIPMQVYRVSIPEKKDKEINVFQEVILKLLRTRNMKPEEIAEKLCLEKELVDFVIKELTNKEYLKDRTLTETGRKLLQESGDVFDYKDGYVFYNYLTKNYEEIFVPDEDYFQTMTARKNEDFIEFSIEEDISKDPKNRRGYIINLLREESENLEVKEILPSEVLTIARRFAQKPNISVAVDKHTSNEDIKVEEEKNKIYFRNAGAPYIHDNLGETVYVVTNIFLPRDFSEKNDTEIEVMYPFFSGISLMLQKEIIKLKDSVENRKLREQINNIKEKVLSLPMDEKGKKSFNKRNSELIEKIFSENIKAYEDIYLALMKLMSSYLKVIEFSRKIGGYWEELQMELPNTIISLYNLNIEIYRELAHQYDYFSGNELCSDSSINGNTIAVITEKLGFNKNRDRIKRYFSVPNFKITISGDVELKSIFAYNLLSANNFDRSHPIYKLVAEKSDFIEDIILLTGLRNTSIHSTEAIDTINEVEKLIFDTFASLEILFDDLEFDKKEFDSLKEEKVDDQENAKSKRDETLFKEESERLYLDVERKYADFTEVLMKNRDLLQIIAEIEAEKKLKGDFYPAKVSKFFENSFKKLLENKALEEITIDEEKDLLQFLESQGFEVKKRPYYNTPRIQRVLNYGFGHSTLGSLLYTYILYLKQNINEEKETKVLLILKEKLKNLFKIIKEVEELRGHNAKTSFDSKDMDYLKNNFERSLEVFLKLIEIN